MLKFGGIALSPLNAALCPRRDLMSNESRCRVSLIEYNKRLGKSTKRTNISHFHDSLEVLFAHLNRGAIEE